jgi:hypothetical protein
MAYDNYINSKEFAQHTAHMSPEEMNNHLSEVRQTLRNELSKNYETKRQMAIRAATSAFKVDATTEEFRYGIGNLLFREWLFDKGTKKTLMGNNSRLKSALNNKGAQEATKASKAWNRVYKVGKSLVGGGWSNYMDDNTTQFSKAFGLNAYNNYLEEVNSPIG